MKKKRSTGDIIFLSFMIYMLIQAFKKYVPSSKGYWFNLLDLFYLGFIMYLALQERALEKRQTEEPESRISKISLLSKSELVFLLLAVIVTVINLLGIR